MKTLFQFISIATLLAISSSLAAQDEQEAFLNRTAEAACNCYHETKTPDMSIEAALGNCMMDYLFRRKAEYDALFGELDYTDTKAMTELGEVIGIKMLDYCPETMIAIGQQQIDDEQSNTQTPDEETTYFVSGQITGVDGGDIAIISMRQLDGKPIKFYWLKYFPGSEVLSSKRQLEMPVEVEYVNVDLYSPTSGEYVTRRVVVALRVLE